MPKSRTLFCTGCFPSPREGQYSFIPVNTQKPLQERRYPHLPLPPLAPQLLLRIRQHTNLVPTSHITHIPDRRHLRIRIQWTRWRELIVGDVRYRCWTEGVDDPVFVGRESVSVSLFSSSSPSPAAAVRSASRAS
jgi:hypothetical protein